MSDARVAELSARLHYIQDKLKGGLLVAVTKYSQISDIAAAYLAGQRDFGENRVETLKEKAQTLGEKYADIRWHFIGHLQSNKINHLLGIPGLSAIHSIDSLKILEAINSRMDKFTGSQLQLFLQINTSGEVEKSGYRDINELNPTLAFIRQGGMHCKLQMVGLMTMGPIRTDDFERDTRAAFTRLVALRDSLQTSLPVAGNFPTLRLSMGMTQDYEMAVEMGADVVRIGSAIFKT